METQTSLYERLYLSFCLFDITASGGSWWNWPGGLREFISGWTYGIIAVEFVLAPQHETSCDPETTTKEDFD